MIIVNICKKNSKELHWQKKKDINQRCPVQMRDVQDQREINNLPSLSTTRRKLLFRKGYNKVITQLYTIYLGVALNFWYPLMTLFTASRKSFSVTVFLLARIAYIPASVHTLLISAPEQKRCIIYMTKYMCTKKRRAPSCLSQRFRENLANFNITRAAQNKTVKVFLD